MQFYTDQSRETDNYALPDARVYQLTAHETVEADEDLIREYMRKHEFRLASMSSRVREAMIDAIVEDHAIEGGWFFDFCFPGCLPESQPFGPYASRDEAIGAAREMASA